ncbi:MAG: NAD(P)-binding protein [Pseudomonadota bacterium]
MRQKNRPDKDQKTDQQLGMGRRIMRRDFVQGVGLAALGLGVVPDSANALPVTAKDADYPPTKTGLRGSHPGSYDAAHAMAREGKSFSNATPLDEAYDLVVVGAGISGLAAAYYYRQKMGADANILILDNHDDFGGHARRNEFHQGGEMRLAIGGTHNLEYWQFSNAVNKLMSELGVDVKVLRTEPNFSYDYKKDEGTAFWFDAETYGENKLVKGFSIRGWSSSYSVETIDQFPISKEARKQLKAFYSARKDILRGQSDEQRERALREMPYLTFLEQHGGLGEEAQQLFHNASHGSWGMDIRCFSTYEALDDAMPGWHLLGEKLPAWERDYPAAFFPDGNASLARLMVQNLIPSVCPNVTAGNIALGKFDYGELDSSNETVRLRLSSTAVNARNSKGGVDVSYIREGKILSVRSKQCVMACYHSIIPHICPDLSPQQSDALKYQVKIPLLLTNVLIRSAAPLNKLGVKGARCPGRMHNAVIALQGINTGGYEHLLSDDGAVPLMFWGSLAAPRQVKHIKDQLRASRHGMLSLSFEDYEREVRTVLDGFLGPAGFDVQKDILAITVNRWPHGYSYSYMDLWDPDWPEGQMPHEIASKPFGNISIANADAGADAYTHVAIDEAYRAVNELTA